MRPAWKVATRPGWPQPLEEDRTALAAASRQAIVDRVASVGVVGLGYVGFPLSVALGEAGFRVVGFDVNAQKVRDIRAGKSPVLAVEQEAVGKLVACGRLDAHPDLRRLAGMDIVLICVPTPWDGRGPDLGAVVEVVETLAGQLRAGALVVLESTVYPGSTETIVAPALARGSGLRPDIDFFVGFSPERIDPGAGRQVREIPKLVSGIGPNSLELVRVLYESIIEQVVPVSSTRVAEFAKLLENSFRHANVALVNELAMVAPELGVDIWQVIEAASTKPFGFMPFYPGPGVGGHCIAVDPLYLLWQAERAGVGLETLAAAQRVNDRMPGYVVARLRGLLGDLEGTRIFVLGVTFKRDVDDVRNSPAAVVIEELLARGAQVNFHDPYVRELAVGDHQMARAEDWQREIQRADCVLILSDHSWYPWEVVAERARLVFDTRNALADHRNRSVHRL